ncbi:MAG: LysM peptidoglycan-binding domain-containing M23 family metallopeptidase [Chloroflexi bacterium]|nr:LysM peptidoglycan-binding domain-containing M23 family metallopeptidase [Chloroflexota bacterium]
MSDETTHKEYPPAENGLVPDQAGRDSSSPLGEANEGSTKYEVFWERVSRTGLIEPVLRIGTILFSIVLVFVVVWAMSTFFSSAQMAQIPKRAISVLAASLPTPTPTADVPGLPLFSVPDTALVAGIPRFATLYTTIPTRPRVVVITYTVETGDSVFGIADKFGLKPETILWANTNILQDNPHRLQVGQIVNIMPVDGTYHKWSAGEDISKVAEYYGVETMKIIEWPGNPFNLYETNFDSLDIAPGDMVIVPGGQREMIDYGPPRIPRDNPAVARTYGPGHCGTLMDGVVGDGVFIWPTANHWLSGFDYNPAANHPAIDIGGTLGDPVWAVDDGVVVYSGWSYSGYGNLIVIDHGNDWQSLYAHLNDVYVGCGTSLYQGAVIGSMGSTGNSSGPHLHFELMYVTTKVNPWNFLP